MRKLRTWRKTVSSFSKLWNKPVIPLGTEFSWLNLAPLPCCPGLYPEIAIVTWQVSTRKGPTSLCVHSGARHLVDTPTILIDCSPEWMCLSPVFNQDAGHFLLDSGLFHTCPSFGHGIISLRKSISSLSKMTPLPEHLNLFTHSCLIFSSPICTFYLFLPIGSCLPAYRYAQYSSWRINKIKPKQNKQK